ncbi:MAG: HAD family phosphatase [Pseudoflavonifractor sp.]|nr:HAD family phosphatase [Alloprevotella sp.]MCM1117527.1 HAD family phosphatase [Pseudoflavonifractor sp.]
MKRFGALFDLDGVIVDSETLYTGFWTEMERRFPTGDPNYAYSIKGMTLTRILDNYSPADREAVVRAIHDFEDTMVYPVMPGVFDTIAMLRSLGAATALVTSSDAVKMDYLFRQHPSLAPLFDVVITGSMVTRSKPDPQGYLMAAEALGVDPRGSLVFEDSIQGLQAGRAAGARVIGMATTFPAERIALLADVVLSTLEGVTPATLGL